MKLEEKMFNVMTNVDKVIKDLDVKFKEVKYKGISHDQVTEMIRAQLIKERILSIVRITNHFQDGNRTEVDVEVEFRDVDDPGQSIIVPGFGYGIDTQDKGPGKAISYAVKYVYLKTFCLLTGDDPEKDNIEYESDKTTFTKVATVPASVKKARLKSYIKNVGGWETFKAAVGDKLDVTSPHNWNDEELEVAIAICRKLEENKG